MPTLRLPVGASSVRADAPLSVAVAPATTSAAAKISHLRIAMCPCLLASASDGEVSWGALASPLRAADMNRRPLSELASVGGHHRIHNRQRPPVVYSVFRSSCIVSCGSEIVGAFGGREDVDEVPDGGPKALDGAFGGLA